MYIKIIQKKHNLHYCSNSPKTLALVSMATVTDIQWKPIQDTLDLHYLLSVFFFLWRERENKTCSCLWFFQSFTGRFFWQTFNSFIARTMRTTPFQSAILFYSLLKISFRFFSLLQERAWDESWERELSMREGRVSSKTLKCRLSFRLEMFLPVGNAGISKVRQKLSDGWKILASSDNNIFYAFSGTDFLECVTDEAKMNRIRNLLKICLKSCFSMLL